MTTALIIGGGVAGPVSALSLQRAGIQSVVYEAYDRTADGIGANLVLAVNGYRALLELGVGHLTAGFDIPRYRYFLGNGRVLAGVRNGNPLPDGTVARAITRSDLYTALRDEAINKGIQMEFGKRLVDAEVTGDGVVAYFADGTEARGDLLIGADGAHSAVRRIIDPNAPALRYGGMVTSSGYARGVDVPGERGTEFMYLGKRAFFSYIHDDQGDIWWYVSPSWPDEPTQAELAAITPQQWRARLLRMFEKDDSPAVKIINATDEITPPRPIYDLPHVPRWCNERMVVVGDACHAVSPSGGQGVSLSIEDAVQLGRCLRDVTDIPRALAHYEEIRRPRVEKVVHFGRSASKSIAVHGQGRRVARDLFLPIAFNQKAAEKDLENMSWLYDHTIDWDAPVAVGV
ncbi:FAD-dependent oxidoreductase [Micromonospora arborensis]|uniref:FAD-dependent oxidoreductase n=1 Tax=Micromonospora arborensis TaxID=2116518 RepID=A0A318NTJ7_9ACTN|nr:NAD(P)/FAD-dependent oxidoreductase [Micromonospora arborensis]PYC63460.1 FAD-dependent oxidoreductase [Micromonospora arborensis]